MPTPYSYDLRIRVITAVEAEERISHVSKTYDVSRETIYQWLKLKKETGDIKAKFGYQKGINSKITDLEEFKEFVEKHRNKTSAEMARDWRNAISASTILRYLRKIDYTRKKRAIFTKNVTKQLGINF